jgi:alanine racemase
MRATIAEINLGHLKYNIQEILKKVTPSQVMAVVKANAYGHGAIPVARTALNAGATHLGVALVEEGIELRKNGIDAPILAFGGAFADQFDDFLKYNLEITLYTLPLIEQLNNRCSALDKKARLHLKIDTGMGRVGVHWKEAVDLIRKIMTFSQVDLVGIYTHFATSDERDKTYALRQLERFNTVVQRLKQEKIHIPLIHAANSGAILDLPAAYFNMVRPGMMMYGWYPSQETSESIPIKPVMSLKTKVLYVKDIAPGESVSYGRRYVAKRATRIVTLPVGYADGYNRLLTNKGKVLIQGKKFPVIGRVCMDLIHARIGKNRIIQAGDEVVLFGKQGDESFSVYDICDLINTIPYEVCCWVSQRVPRIYIEE